jgi:hypothetical protein
MMKKTKEGFFGTYSMKWIYKYLKSNDDDELGHIA